MKALRKSCFVKIYKFQWENARGLNFEWSCLMQVYRSSHPEVFSVKGVLKICSKLTGEHPCRSAISIKLQRTPLGGCFSSLQLCYQNTIVFHEVFRTTVLQITIWWLSVSCFSCAKSLFIMKWLFGYRNRISWACRNTHAEVCKIITIWE